MKRKLTHIERQVVRITKWWMLERDPKKKEFLRRQAVKMGKFIERGRY